MSNRAASLFIVAAVALPLFAQTSQDEVRRTPSPRATIPMPVASAADPNAGMPSERPAVPLAQPAISTLGANGLSIVGTVSYSFSGSTARLKADRIENANFLRTSGTLRISLWMSASGYRQFGYRTAVYTLGQLSPNAFFFNVDSGTIAFTAPPTGCYYGSMFLEEFQSDGTYAAVDYVDFPNLIQINGGVCSATCALSLSSSDNLLPSMAATAGFGIISGPNPCTGSWAATADASWITIVSGGSGSSAGTTVLTYTVPANPSPLPRTGTITVAPPRTRGSERIFTVTQAGSAPVACTFVLSPPSNSVGSGAATGNFTVAAGPNGCGSSWSATSNASWLTVTAGGSGSGSGNTTLTYAVAANPSASLRTGIITVSDPRSRGSEQNYTVTQAVGGGSCTSNPTTLCLSNSRFRVTAQWKTRDGTTGNGQGVPLTSETGYYWFFGSSNVEMVVKVIDACSFNQRFWVFAGGLTDVNVTLNVTDTKTGVSRTYTNPLGAAFQPIQDTSAFSTCP